MLRFPTYFEVANKKIRFENVWYNTRDIRDFYKCSNTFVNLRI